MVDGFDDRDVSFPCACLRHDSCREDWCECGCHGARSDLRRAFRHSENPWTFVAVITTLYALAATAVLWWAMWERGWRPWDW